MFTIFGYPVGNAANIGSFVVLAGIFGFCVRVYIAGAPARAVAKNEGDASLRKSLMERIDKLEETQVTDRDRHADERRKDREECDIRNKELEDRIRKQNETIDGLQRQLIMFQVASARALPLGAPSPEMEAMLASLGVLYAAPSEKSDTLKAAEETRHAADVTVEQVHQDEAQARAAR